MQLCQKANQVISSYEELLSELQGKSLTKQKEIIVQQLDIRVKGFGWTGWKFVGNKSGRVAEVVQLLKHHFEMCFGNPNLTNLPIPLVVLDMDPMPYMGDSKQHVTQQYVALEQKSQLKWDAFRDQFTEAFADEANIGDSLTNDQPPLIDEPTDDNMFAFLSNYLRSQIVN